MTTSTTHPTPLRRRLAIVGVFALGTWAIAATSSSYKQIDVAGATGTLRLDAEHPVVLARARIAFNPEATASYGMPSFELRVDPPRPAGAGATSPAPTATATGMTPPAARFFVMTAVVAPASPDPQLAGSTPPPWQAEATPGVPVALPVTCQNGPCERAFWLIAQLDGDAPGALDADWHVDGHLSYGGDWPSGAGATITVDPPVPFPGPVPAIATSTEPETIRIGAGSPAAARVVEAEIGPEAIGAGTDPVAALSVDVRYRTGPGDTSPTVLVRVYPLEAQLGSEAAASPMPDGADPFGGCAPAEACTRRFLVTFAWAGGDTRDMELDWSMTVRRTDLLRVWTTPSALAARVTRRLDLATTDPVISHLEGNVTPVSTDRDPQVRVRVTSETTSDDSLAALLPLPASFVYRVRLDGPVPSGASTGDTTVSITVRLPDEGTNTTYGYLDDGSLEVPSGLVSRSGACRIGERCDLEIRVSPPSGSGGTPAEPGAGYSWTLDLATYSYVDVPVQVEVD